jgi:hypothetical protein
MENLPLLLYGLSLPFLEESIFTQALEQQGFPVIGFTEPLLALDHFLKNSYLYWLVVSDISVMICR